MPTLSWKKVTDPYQDWVPTWVSTTIVSGRFQVTQLGPSTFVLSWHHANGGHSVVKTYTTKLAAQLAVPILPTPARGQ